MFLKTITYNILDIMHDSVKYALKGKDINQEFLELIKSIIK